MLFCLFSDRSLLPYLLGNGSAGMGRGRGESKRPNNQTQQSIKPTLVYLHEPTTLSDEHYKDQHAVLQFQEFGFQISRICFIPTPSVLKSLLKSEVPPPPRGGPVHQSGPDSFLGMDAKIITQPLQCFLSHVD